MDKFDNDLNRHERQPNHELNSRRGSLYNEHRRTRYEDSEFAADLLANDVTDGNSTSGAVIAGGVGLAASVVALFTYPVILGLAGIALGCYAVAKGNKILGFLTIGIGLLAAIMPLFYTGPFMSMF